MKKKNLKTLSLKKNVITSFEEVNGGAQPPSIYYTGCISCIKSCVAHTKILGCVKSFDSPC